MKKIMEATEENAVSVVVRVHPFSEFIGEGLKEQCVRVARSLKKYVDGNFKVAEKIVIYHGYRPDNKYLLYTKEMAPDDWVLKIYDY